MSILIKGVKLPSSCWLCAYEGILPCPCSTEPASDYKNKRHPECPLVEVPEPHGRLIDGDRLCRHIEPRGEWSEIYVTVAGMITVAPTVIEAEEQEHE